MIRLGVNPVGWSNDDLPALGEHNSLERCLRDAREAGYQGIELGRKFPRDPVVLGQLLERHGIRLVSGWYGGRLLARTPEEELRAAGSHIELLRALGCEVMIYAEVTGSVHGNRTHPLDARLRLEEAGAQRFGAQLSTFADRLSDVGLRLAYHHHMGTVVQTPDEIETLLEVTRPSVGLNLDTGHVAFAGGDPELAARRWGSRVCHVHLKDVRQTVVAAATRRPCAYLDAIVDGVFTVPGDGDISFGPVLRGLKDAGYEGWLVVEADQDPDLAEPALFARMGRQHVEDAARTEGLKISGGG